MPTLCCPEHATFRFQDTRKKRTIEGRKLLSNLKRLRSLWPSCSLHSGEGINAKRFLTSTEPVQLLRCSTEVLQALLSLRPRLAESALQDPSCCGPWPHMEARIL